MKTKNVKNLLPLVADELSKFIVSMSGIIPYQFLYNPPIPLVVTIIEFTIFEYNSGTW
jgi:hypothetical protein